MSKCHIVGNLMHWLDYQSKRFRILYAAHDVLCQLTHLSQMDLPILISRRSPFTFLGVLGGIVPFILSIEHFVSKQRRL